MRVFLMTSLLAACAGAAPDDPAGMQEAGGELAANRLLEDEELEGDQTITAVQVQAFLVAKGSALVTYYEAGHSAAELIVSESIAQHISPLYMLARIDGESSLVSSGTLEQLGSATGCGCPDGEQCDPGFAGFAPQVRCAGQLVRTYLTDLDTKGSTISGWQVDVAKWTLDPCLVTPRTRATAALYTYTPWVGAHADECGATEWGGSSLMAALVHEFGDALAAAPAVCPYGDGLYCGGNAITGDPSTLYQCTDGALTVSQMCAAGCDAKPPGFDDACK
jgi:hypothetical protein